MIGCVRLARALRIFKLRSFGLPPHTPPPFLASSLTEVTAKRMGIVLFLQLVLSAVELGLCVYIINSNRLARFETIAASIGCLTVLISTFVYCLLSENMTADMATIGTSVYECAWFRLPVKQQKLAMLAIQRAQKEFRMTGLGFVRCSLEVFASVSRQGNQIGIFIYKKLRVLTF